MDINFIIVKYTSHKIDNFNHFYVYSSVVLNSQNIMQLLSPHPLPELFLHPRQNVYPSNNDFCQ